MSMTRDARDTASFLFYGKALEALREAHLEKAANGEQVTPDYWEKGEAEALRRTREEFFNLQVRRVFLEPRKAETLSDQEDFDARSSELAELGTLETHRILAGIPWVGHPGYADEEAPPPPGQD